MFVHKKSWQFVQPFLRFGSGVFGGRGDSLTWGSVNVGLYQHGDPLMSVTNHGRHMAEGQAGSQHSENGTSHWRCTIVKTEERIYSSFRCFISYFFSIFGMMWMNIVLLIKCTQPHPSWRVRKRKHALYLHHPSHIYSTSQHEHCDIMPVPFPCFRSWGGGRERERERGKNYA